MAANQDQAGIPRRLTLEDKFKGRTGADLFTPAVPAPPRMAPARNQVEISPNRAPTRRKSTGPKPAQSTNGKEPRPRRRRSFDTTPAALARSQLVSLDSLPVSNWRPETLASKLKAAGSTVYECAEGNYFVRKTDLEAFLDAARVQPKKVPSAPHPRRRLRSQ